MEHDRSRLLAMFPEDCVAMDTMCVPSPPYSDTHTDVTQWEPAHNSLDMEEQNKAGMSVW